MINKKALTLPELLIAAAILVLVITGILVSYVTCIRLAELAKNSSIAIHLTKARLETIKNTDYDQIKITFDNQLFGEPGFNGIGVTYVDDTNPELLLITATFCWSQAGGQIIGEDKNLNGQINGAEDVNGNGILDSLVQLNTFIYKR